MVSEEIRSRVMQQEVALEKWLVINKPPNLKEAKNALSKLKDTLKPIGNNAVNIELDMLERCIIDVPDKIGEQWKDVQRIIYQELGIKIKELDY